MEQVKPFEWQLVIAENLKRWLQREGINCRIYFLGGFLTFVNRLRHESENKNGGEGEEGWGKVKNMVIVCSKFMVVLKEMWTCLLFLKDCC